MHLPNYALAAAVCALITSASPLPIADTPNIPSGLDPLGRRDSPLSNLFPEKDGFIQTGPPVHRERSWHTDDGPNDDDPLRRRDSPLHSLPKDGIVEIKAPGPRIEVP